MAEKISIGVYVTQDQYRALTQIANAKTTDPVRPVQVHHLIENLVDQALTKGDRKKKPTARINVAQLLRLHGEGLNDREIAAAMGIHQGTVWMHRKELDLQKNTTQGRPRRQEKTA